MPSKRTREAMRAVALEFLEVHFAQAIADKVLLADIAADLIARICEVVPKQKKEYFRDRQRARKLAGKCHSCPADSRPGKAYCEQCGKMALLAQKIKRRQAIENGYCCRCGKLQSHAKADAMN